MVITPKGYRLVYAPNCPIAKHNRMVLEHRLVLSRKLGRWLRPDERVHHVNGDRLDNRPENLELLDSVARHNALHPQSTLRACADCGELAPIGRSGFCRRCRQRVRYLRDHRRKRTSTGGVS